MSELVKEINKHVEYLVKTLDTEQWKSLSHIRNRPYPVSLVEKRVLISEMLVTE